MEWDVKKMADISYTLAKIKENTDKILEFHQNKVDLDLLNVKLVEITEQIDILTDRNRKLTSQVKNATHFFELIVEYTQLARDGDTDTYKGHLIQLRNLAETGITNLNVLGKDNDR